MKKTQKGIIVMIICFVAFSLPACKAKEKEEIKLALKEDASIAQYIYQKDGTDIIDVRIAYDNPESEDDVMVEFLVAAETENGKYNDIQVIKTESNYENSSLQVNPLEKTEVITVMVTHAGDVENIFDIEKDGDKQLKVKLVK